MCITISAITNTFADKSNDSRYEGTFTTTYRGNWTQAGNTPSTLINANGLEVSNGGAILSFLNVDDPIDAYDVANGGVGAGVLPHRSDFVISPIAISRIVFPGL